MITDKILPKLRFTIRQAVNPYINQNANKFLNQTVELPATISKKAINGTRKILNKDVVTHSQPNTDMVVLSSGTTKATKATKTDNHNRGKNIRNVLENYFDNKSATTIDAELAKTDKNDKTHTLAKEENLKQLVKSYEKENLSSPRENRKQALKLMIKEGKELYETLRQGYKDMITDLKKNDYYAPDSDDIKYLNIYKK